MPVMRWYGHIVVVAALAWATPSHALDAEDRTLPFSAIPGGSVVGLRVMCTEPGDEAQYTCLMTITAAMDAHDVIADEWPDAAVYCPSRLVHPEKARGIFLAWSGDEGKQLPVMSAGIAVLAALADEYPCR